MTANKMFTFKLIITKNYEVACAACANIKLLDQPIFLSLKTLTQFGNTSDLSCAI